MKASFRQSVNLVNLFFLHGADSHVSAHKFDEQSLIHSLSKSDLFHGEKLIINNKCKIPVQLALDCVWDFSLITY